MKRRINSTGRKRIERRHVRVQVHRLAGQDRPRIEAAFELQELKLPPTAEIRLEAKFGGFAQRFEWGTVERPAPETPPEITEVRSDRRLSFSVKIVDPSNHRLLALARKLYPVGEDGDDGGRRELFRVRARPLGQELWRVVLDDDGAPFLELNADVPDVLARFREPGFRAAILPAAMRTVLLEVDDDVNQEDDPESWEQRWFRFAELMADEERPDTKEPSAMHDWIDRACSAFAGRFQLVSAMGVVAEGARDR